MIEDEHNNTSIKIKRLFF